MVRSDLVGDSHINPPAGPFGVFRIGQIDPDTGYVHVFDDENLDIVLSELDTVADFVGYLSRKEAFLCSGRVVLATGEEDLLAHYLTHTNDDGEHDFVVPPQANVIEFDHLFQGMPEDAQYLAKKAADKISYLIDDLIEHVSRTPPTVPSLPVMSCRSATTRRPFGCSPQRTDCHVDIWLGRSSISFPRAEPPGAPRADA